DLCAFGNFKPDRDSGDAQLVAAPVISLHQHAHCISAELFVNLSRSGADAAFEFVADHPGSAADVAFGDRPRLRAVEGGKRMLRPDVIAVDVVEPAVVSFRNDR